MMATTGIALRSKTLPKQQTISKATINFDLEKRLILMFTRIQLFRERLSEKKAPKCTRQDRKLVWVFTGILHIGLEEMSKFVFFAGEKCNFPLKRPLSVALLLLSHVFELENFFLNSEWLNVPCFQMLEERENVQIRVDYVAISH